MAFWLRLGLTYVKVFMDVKRRQKAKITILGFLPISYGRVRLRVRIQDEET